MTSADAPKLAHAILTSLSTGWVELDRDWPDGSVPSLSIEPDNELVSIEKLPPQLFGLESGYFIDGEKITFILDPAHYPWLRDRRLRVFLGGSFNNWSPWEEEARWELKETRVAERVVLAVSFADPDQLLDGGAEFKFITEQREWLSPPDMAPNRAQNELWNTNLQIDPIRTGHHRFSFKTQEKVDLSCEMRMIWQHNGDVEKLLLRPGDFFYEMRSDLPLGAVVEGEKTVFRIFAPRAQRVEVLYFRRLTGERVEHRLDLRRNPDGTWETTVGENLHQWFYWLFLHGERNTSVHFLPNFPVVDPYALALVGREGPGIVLDRTRIRRSADAFHAPPWQDLVLAEIHVRDAIARAPVSLTEQERKGFSGLKKWVQSKSSYLRKLGVNAVELQPVQEFDNQTEEEYHWGYMPVNYFAPESSYGQHPERASQVTELQDLVQAFHAEGMAVILDVVYNHVGIPNYLFLIDKQYYFEIGADGDLINWSGCGNDLRPDAAMARRLIIDSLVYFVDVFKVDGFRFDLAELLGVETLLEIEKRLKEVKPDIILIAEPWSFRGHIGRQLRDTGFSSWNDGFRDFLRGFVRGEGNREAVQFFLSGSPGALATWPAQTVNYVESHDDRTWIDMITENPDHNGFHPTENDLRRTHLMAAFLFCALGIPMIAGGQDFLRSKYGVNNSYQRGDLNALDYLRLEQFKASHEYFSGWIRFRLSEQGKLFRLWERPTNTYLSFSFADDGLAFAAIYNADRSQAGGQILLALNPHDHEASIPLADEIGSGWIAVADAERVAPEGLGETETTPSPRLSMPPLAAGLWIRP